MPISDFVRRIGAGRVLLALYHRPVGRMRQSLRNGGPFAEQETERQRRQMESAALDLGRLPQFAQPATVPLHLMTGRRFWYQTAFCLHSFAQAARCNVTANLYDDGSIDEQCASRLARLGPNVRIHFQPELRAKLEQLLPADRFPTLRDRWESYPNIRKLIDVHLGSTGWKLVIDSDLLFFRRPDALLAWAAAPHCLLHAIDCTESYGYSRPLLESLAGTKLPTKLNVGICGLRSEALDWAQLEAWTAELQRQEKTNYYLEQALVALLAVHQPAIALPAEDYITKPARAEVENPKAVMHHYVDNSKRWYFRLGWRQAITNR